MKETSNLYWSFNPCSSDNFLNDFYNLWNRYFSYITSKDRLPKIRYPPSRRCSSFLYRSFSFFFAFSVSCFFFAKRIIIRWRSEWILRKTYIIVMRGKNYTTCNICHASHNYGNLPLADVIPRNSWLLKSAEIHSFRTANTHVKKHALSSLIPLLRQWLRTVMTYFSHVFGTQDRPHLHESGLSTFCGKFDAGGWSSSARRHHLANNRQITRGFRLFSGAFPPMRGRYMLLQDAR